MIFSNVIWRHCSLPSVCEVAVNYTGGVGLLSDTAHILIDLIRTVAIQAADVVNATNERLLKPVNYTSPKLSTSLH